MNSDHSFYTIKELCSILKVKESWLRRQIYYKKIPYFKLGRLIRFHKKEINQWLRNKPLEKISKFNMNDNK